MGHRVFLWAAATSAACGLSSLAAAEFIHFEPAGADVLPGASTATVVRLAQSETPLFGYSLDIQIVPMPGAMGSLSVDVGATTFHDPENLITAGGATRDPIFSVIQAQADGAFISTNTFDLSALTATPGVNDALARIVFNASDDAMGDFAVFFGPGSALSDASGFAVPFTYESATIHVVPGPSALCLLSAMARRRRRS